MFSSLFTLPSVLAIAVGLISSTGENAKIVVRNTSRAPQHVRVVAIDREFQVIEEAKAMPGNLILGSSGTNARRNVFVQYPPETFAVCARVEPVTPEDVTKGAPLTFQACQAVEIRKTTNRFGARGLDNLEERLRRALNPNNDNDVTIEIQK